MGSGRKVLPVAELFKPRGLKESRLGGTSEIAKRPSEGTTIFKNGPLWSVFKLHFL